MDIRARVGRGTAGLVVAVSLLSCSRAEAPAVKPPEALGPQEVFRKVSPSVFVVEVRGEGRRRTLGSAVAVTADTVVTNKHVAQPPDAVIHLKSGKTRWRAFVSYMDPRHDLCLLVAPGLHAVPVPPGSPADAQVGARVFTVGAPAGLELSLSEGLISGMRELEELNNQPVIQTTAAISPGSSGGGLFDVRGHLVGVTTAFLREGQNLNFAIPAAAVQEILPRRDEDAWRLFTRGIALGQASRKAESQAALRRAVGMDAEMAAGRYALGASQPSEGELLSAVRIDAQMVESWFQLARLQRQGVDQMAREASRRVRRSGVTGAGGRAHPGGTAAGAAAVRYMEEAVKASPEVSEYWHELGLSYRNEERYDEAAHAFRRAAEIDPGDPCLLLDAADLYAGAGDAEQAAALYARSAKAKSQSSTDCVCQQSALGALKGFWGRVRTPLDLYPADQLGRVNSEFVRLLSEEDKRLAEEMKEVDAALKALPLPEH